MWHLDSDVLLVRHRDLEKGGYSKGNNTFLLMFVILRLFTFRGSSIILLIYGTIETLKYEVEETKNILVQQCL
jgi:hypothetical protein